MHLLLIFLALIFGGFLRLYGALQSSFPLNDGALFYTMTSELAANHFILPEFSNYNNLNIPFAYPPLGFYLSGLLNQVTGWDLLDIFRILPAVFTIFSILAFYLLALDLIENKNQAGLATLIFSFLPAAYDWQIMGGGITRAPAFFFSLLALHFIYRMYSRGGVKQIILAILFSGLTVLCHPETTVHTIAAALIFFLFFGRNKTGVIRSVITAAGVIVLSSPWWLTVLLRHGIVPFTSAGKVGFSGIEWLFHLITFDLTNELNVQTIAVLALLGLALLIFKRKYLLPALFLAIFIAAPRSAARSLSPVIALMASYTLTIFFSLIHPANLSHPFELHPEKILESKLSKLFLGILIIQWLISTFTLSNTLLNERTLTTADRAAFDWVINHTPVNSRFLILTGENPLLDPVSEWFPTLTGHQSVATLYGYEWKPDVNFKQTRQTFANLQSCLSQETDCVMELLEMNNIEIDYLLIRNLDTRSNQTDEIHYQSALQDAFLQNDQFNCVYNSPEISIFIRK